MVMNVNIKKIIISLALVFTPLLLIGSAVTTSSVSAQGSQQTPAVNKCGDGITFFPSWYKGLCDPATGNIQSPGDPDLGSNTSERLGKWVTIIAMNIVTMILYVVGYVSLGFIIYGGFKYMISGDSSSGTLAARKTITNAVIGLVLSIMSVALVTFIADRITG